MRFCLPRTNSVLILRAGNLRSRLWNLAPISVVPAGCAYFLWESTQTAVGGRRYHTSGTAHSCSQHRVQHTHADNTRGVYLMRARRVHVIYVLSCREQRVFVTLRATFPHSRIWPLAGKLCHFVVCHFSFRFRRCPFADIYSGLLRVTSLQKRTRTSSSSISNSKYQRQSWKSRWVGWSITVQVWACFRYRRASMLSQLFDTATSPQSWRPRHYRSSLAFPVLLVPLPPTCWYAFERRKKNDNMLDEKKNDNRTGYCHNAISTSD
jgi:hypothetical protein